MQRLLSSKLASKLSHSTSNHSSSSSSLFNSYPYKTVTSLTKLPKSQSQSQSHFLSHRPPYNPHSWRSQHNLPPKIHAFLFSPLLAKRFLHASNTLLSATRRTLADCRIGFLSSQFPKRGFHLNQDFSSYKRSWRSWLRGLTPNDMVLGLIIANVAIFLLWRVADYRFMMNNFTISVENFKRGRLHTLITSAFSHTDMEHIIHNMIGLYFFGSHLGHVFGSEFLLKLYLAGALAGCVFYLMHSAFLASSSKGQQLWMDPLKAPGLGASGAVNAILLLDIFLYPKSTLYFNFFIPVPAILLGIYLVGKDVLGMIEGDTPGSAHLGGAAVAALAWAQLRKGRPFRF
ncbi:RHOMBOID-like protein 12, mitochondrial [Humulus lupulus]|uniref:RHOMBOID-like protein 12, mitochondrial n=1 Tax=Humulus lupulus TaxID=3486 RepID=UPI002B4121B1|nr:RHOMBOID-like protein 12, mitochondrial [Humulus lupulus]